jgi:hypothetical protein
MHCILIDCIYICASLFKTEVMFRITFGFCLFCLFCLSSCSYYNYTYIQTPVSVPDLTKRGDLKVQANVNLKEGTAEIAYSPINHIGVTASATSGFVKETKGWEAGLGYYLAKKEYLFSMYGGVGYGDLVNKGSFKEWFGEDNTQWNNHSNYSKFYLQASLGRELWKICRVSLAIRGSYVLFDSYGYSFNIKNYTDKKSYVKLEEQFDTLEISNASALIIEPVVNATFFHTRRFSLIAQVGFTLVHRYGQFREAHSVDLSTYQPSASNASTASQAQDKTHPLVCPVTFSIGGRINISTRSNKTK